MLKVEVSQVALSPICCVKIIHAKITFNAYKME